MPNIDTTLIFQQLPLVADHVAGQQNLAASQAAASSHLAFQHLRRETQRTPKIDKDEGVNTRYDASQQGRGGATPQRNGSRADTHGQSDDTPFGHADPDSPWSGNLVNKTV